MKYNKNLISILLSCIILVSACSSSKEKTIAEKASAEDLYEDATTKLSGGQYDGAIELYEDIERTYPYSPLAIKSKLMIGFTQYRDGESDSAVASLERFIRLHPGNKDASYAYYLKALCYYEQITDVGRDQSITEKSLAALKEVVARFPESEYARDALLKIDLVHDHLAGKEMEIGRFYLRQLKLIAAINRFKKVVDSYQTTSHVAEALHRLVESYLLLGVATEAQKYAAVLGANYPGSSWYEKSYQLMQKNGLDIPVDEETDSNMSESSSIMKKIWPFSGSK
jgi:outer membrane protein assembly factor BamD